MMTQEDFEEQASKGECPVCAVQTRKADTDNFKTKVEKAQEVDRGKMLNGK